MLLMSHKTHFNYLDFHILNESSTYTSTFSSLVICEIGAVCRRQTIYIQLYIRKPKTTQSHTKLYGSSSSLTRKANRCCCICLRKGAHSSCIMYCCNSAWRWEVKCPFTRNQKHVCVRVWPKSLSADTAAAAPEAWTKGLRVWWLILTPD